MTAILISREIRDNKDTLYVAADQRVSSDDLVISDHNKKIFTFEPDMTHEYRRHYVTVGDVMPTDYIINKIEALASLDDLYGYMFENELLTRMKGNIVFYIVVEVPGKPQIIQVYKNDKRSGVVNHNLDEVVHNPIFDGSGGAALLSAYSAYTDLVARSEGEEKLDFTIPKLIYLSFKVAAKTISSMNANVTLLEIPIKKVRRSKKS